MSCCLLFAAMILQGQDINIPADYQTIQEGINASNPGDTIIVADGIYYERINFMGKKPLIVASMYLTDGNEDHIANTILDGSLIPYSNRSVVNFVLQEDTTSVLCGFTIQHGTGTYYEADGLAFRAGGGIFISGSGAKIIHNHLTENLLNFNLLADTIDIFDGSAIATQWMADQSWVVIENNVIDHNTCISKKYQAGGAGICVYCNTRIADNIITDNISMGQESSSAFSGAVACATDPAWNTTVTAIIKNNLIADNTAQSENSWACGAGAYIQHVIGIFQDNIVQDNQLITYPTAGGSGGLGVYLPLEGTIISGNRFINNSSTLWSGALTLETTQEEVTTSRILVENNYFINNQALKGGAVSILGVPVNFQNNVFSSNFADAHGGAIFAWKTITISVHHMVKLVNNSFFDNHATNGGAFYSVHCKPLVFNTVFYNDMANLGPEFYIPYSNDSLEIAFSNLDMSKVYGMINDGGDNITVDPIFKDSEELTLEDTSPCVDAGTNSFTCDCGVLHNCPLYDIDLVPRENSPIDMGAHEIFSTGLPQLRGNIDFATLDVYPNPASDKTYFEYDLVVPGHIRLSIYDLAGREIDLLTDELQVKGNHKIMWSIENQQPGIYFYRLYKTNSYQLITGKLIILE